jgi:hypothetical protein
MKILAPLLSLLVCLGSAIGQGITRNSVTTNAWPKVFPAANDVLLWDGVNNRWTNGTASTTATNAISDINGSSSNHQFIVIWSAAETSNTFGIQTAQGAAGGTNFFHFPVADLTHSGVLTSNDWRIFAGLQFTNADPSQFSVANRTLYFISGAMATNLNANGITNRGFTLLQGNTIAATNGWLQFGDPVNTQQITNYDNTWFYGSAFVQPSRIFQFWNSSIALITNSTLLVGGSDLTTNTIRFNSQGYIADSVTDASEDLRYRLGSTTIGWHSNDVVRMRDLTNITVNLLTNLTVNPNQLVSAGQPLTIIAGAKQTNLTSYGWETFNGPFTNSSTFVFSSPGGFFDIVDALDFFTFFNGIKVTNSLGLFKMPQTNRVLFLDGSNHVTNVTSQAASTDLVYADGSAHPLISGYSLTNTVTYGNTVTFPGVLPIPRVLKLDGDGILSSVVSAAPSSDFVHADGSVGSAGAPNMNTNTVLVGSQPTISLWSGTGVKVYATNNGAASRIDYTFDGAVSLPTNQNQFVSLAGDNTLNIKNGALLTNVIERGITEPNLTVSRVVMVNPSGNLTNVVGTASDFLKVDGSSSAGTSLAAGNTADIQFNQGNSLAGTNRFTYVRNATDGDALGIMVAKVAGNTTPGIKISDTGSTFDLYLHPRGLTTTNGSLIAKAGTLSWVLDSTTGSWGPNGTDVSQDLGGVTTHVRTNWSGTLDVSNIVQRGFKMEIPQKLSTNGAAIFSSVVTNLIADGGLGNVFTNFNISFGGITNVYATNLQDHQEIKLLVFVAPGSSVVFPQFTATNFLSGMVEAPDTNVVSEIKIWRTGNFTNLSVKTREYTLTNGTSVTFTTNYVAGAIAINSSAGGGGSGIIQIQTNNAIIGNQTNINFFGDNMTLSATNNSASNKVDLPRQQVCRDEHAERESDLQSDQLCRWPSDVPGSARQ